MSQQLKHLHILYQAKIKEPKALSVAGLNNWVAQVVQNQGMEIVAGPFVTYVGDPGNEGPTGGVHIKTSHFAFHIWETEQLIQTDLYTCGELNVPQFLSEFVLFDPEWESYLVLDRERNFVILESIQQPAYSGGLDESDGKSV